MHTMASSSASARDGAAALGGEGGGGGFAFLGRAMGEGEGRGGDEPTRKRQGERTKGAWPCDSVRRWHRTASGGAFCFPFRDDSLLRANLKA